jgi:hypothetical protein
MGEYFFAKKNMLFKFCFIFLSWVLKNFFLNNRPGYKELREVEVVKHDKICSGVIKDVPSESGRFLGDISGMAEYLNGSVIFCRHKSCWRLDVARNSWSKVIELVRIIYRE